MQTKRSIVMEVVVSIYELIAMEDLFISEEGQAVKDVMDGFCDGLFHQIDGGLKCLDIIRFKMLLKYLQLQVEQIRDS